MIEFEQLRSHVGHDVHCVMYGLCNVTVECHTCNEVIYSADEGWNSDEED